MRNQNKRQTTGLFALIFNETFSLCIKLYICWNADDVIVVTLVNVYVDLVVFTRIAGTS